MASLVVKVSQDPVLVQIVSVGLESCDHSPFLLLDRGTTNRSFSCNIPIWCKYCVLSRQDIVCSLFYICTYLHENTTFSFCIKHMNIYKYV